MRVLLLSAFDTEGGAAIAAYRLLKGLSALKINSKMLVKKKKTNDRDVIGPNTLKEKIISQIAGTLDLVPSEIFHHKKFSTAWAPDYIFKLIKKSNPDLVHLHWINSGFMRIETLKKISMPVVWTLHDMWPFTGGCHYSYECDNYKDYCKYCPQLNSKREKDLAYSIFKRKIKKWNMLNIKVVAPSRWMARKAIKSSIFKNREIEIIPNGLDTKIYKPHNKKNAREVFNISKSKKVILFGATNPLNDKRKGYRLFSNAINKLSKYEDSEKLNIVVFGDFMPEKEYNLGIKSYYLGYLHDDYSLALLYSISDVLVVPSIQESFGQTASESMACGTPVVAFSDTGLSDIVDHKVNGYLAKPYLEEDIARGISWTISDKKRHKYLSNNARIKAVSKFSQVSVAKSYKELYLKLLNK